MEVPAASSHQMASLRRDSHACHTMFYSTEKAARKTLHWMPGSSESLDVPRKEAFPLGLRLVKAGSSGFISPPPHSVSPVGQDRARPPFGSSAPGSAHLAVMDTASPRGTEVAAQACSGPRTLLIFALNPLTVDSLHVSHQGQGPPKYSAFSSGPQFPRL